MNTLRQPSGGGRSSDKHERMTYIIVLNLTDSLVVVYVPNLGTPIVGSCYEAF